jgi:bacteriocin-like protein
MTEEQMAKTEEPKDETEAEFRDESELTDEALETVSGGDQNHNVA